jgi:hypothetical protein
VKDTVVFTTVMSVVVAKERNERAATPAASIPACEAASAAPVRAAISIVGAGVCADPDRGKDEEEVSDRAAEEEGRSLVTLSVDSIAPRDLLAAPLGGVSSKKEALRD